MSELVLIRWRRTGKGIGGTVGERLIVDEYAPLLRFLREGGHPETIGLVRGTEDLILKVVVRRKFADMVFGIVERRFGPLTHSIHVAGTFAKDPLLDESATPYRAGLDLATRIGIELLEQSSERANIGLALKGLTHVTEGLRPYSYTLRRTPSDVFWPLMERRSPDGGRTGLDVLRDLVLGFN